ncbi:hypothetical protein A6F68_02325 [Tsuneonella dongtanensis]|uniref:DUF1206 domain-containing protein n=1 Tax=Tsuneonella dongtanensis TaxID=692370 RepID=A0A1B2AFL6_9SPHN|nr:DUF1206 domain-containing protein [Tsuneonella dongtanensis]ANY20825.1 hypothetical protein A6F68_02325 [Tsuneonella dongtanensis]
MVDKSEKFSWFVRLGYAARGVVYILLGYIALSTVGKADDGQAAVFDMMQDVPFGTPLLYLIALGLLAYAAFKAIDAATDIENHGDDAKGKAKRIGAAASAIAHTLLAWTAYQFASGTKQQSEGAGGQSQETASTLLSWDLGALALGIVGVGFIVGAAMQAKSAWTASFMKHIGGGAPRHVKPIGRAGHAARAIVFLLIGWSLVKSAWLSQSSEVKGLGEAIVALSGSGIYSLVAIGLIFFGVFSLITSRYRIIPDIQKGDLKPHL